jgi:radical SAM superfamily enzyme YgiQ (UPF0313 family)
MGSVPMKRRRRLVLIQPRFANAALDRNKGAMPPLGLAYVAAYTPATWEIEVHDEQVEPEALPAADLVGLTTTSLTITRAYEIAAHYRARGTPVVLGGVHASSLPAEAEGRADAVVVGDVERVWETVVRDAEAGRLQPRYDGEMGPLDDLRRPRLDLFRSRYTYAPVSASRGCPFRCDFCAINRFYGGTYRRRPVEGVLEDLRHTGRPFVFFTDGNLYGHSQRDRAAFVELCREIVKARRCGRLPWRAWTCYASVNALDDDEALGLAREAGCRALLVGFESIDPESLREMNKSLNLRFGPESYPRLIENAHRHGLVVVGELVVGTDHDTLETLRQTARFIDTSNLDLLRLQILQPLPGTKLFDRLQSEGRLHLHDFPADWERLSDDFILGVHYETRHLSRRELQQWVVDTGRRFYAPGPSLLRSLKAGLRSRDAVAPALLLFSSWSSGRSYRNYVVR